MLRTIISLLGLTSQLAQEQQVNDQREAESIIKNRRQPILPTDNISQRFTQLMVDEQFFLTPNLKITDVARRLDICRTYISIFINQKYGVSFSDYNNRLRITYAKQLLLQTPTPKILVIAQKSGFSTEMSFYRNFRKFTGMKPSQWLAQQDNCDKTPII